MYILLSTLCITYYIRNGSPIKPRHEKAPYLLWELCDVWVVTRAPLWVVREDFDSGMTHNSKPQQAELQRCDGGGISITAFRFSVLHHLSSSGIKLALKSCDHAVSILSSQQFFSLHSNKKNAYGTFCPQSCEISVFWIQLLKKKVLVLRRECLTWRMGPDFLNTVSLWRNWLLTEELVVQAHPGTLGFGFCCYFHSPTNKAVLSKVPGPPRGSDDVLFYSKFLLSTPVRASGLNTTA